VIRVRQVKVGIENNNREAILEAISKKMRVDVCI